MKLINDMAFQSIHTKYLGPTDRRGSRIKATTEAGISVTVHYDDSLSGFGPHLKAVELLTKKCEWGECKFAVGGTKEGYVFVLVKG